MIESYSIPLQIRLSLGGGYEYVDLGLPSGLKWAKCNVGAESETDYGYYFQWGDIVDKSNADCSWASYKYGNGSSNNLTKYCTKHTYGTVDGKTTLGPEDDAATQIMGGKWRMPTQTEFQELLKNTNQKWVEDFNGSGVSGMKFTGSNGNSIFIPNSGYREGSSFNFQGNRAIVWSSSLDTDNSTLASRLLFRSDFISEDGSSNRCNGYVVRGVL